MPSVDVAPNETGNVGPLLEDRIFFVSEGSINFTTDGSSDRIPFGIGEKIVFSAGLTVNYTNSGVNKSAFVHMPI